MAAAKDLFEAALAAEGVTGKLADVGRSIYFQESRSGKNTQTSNAGAKGGMQIIPSTFASVADRGWNIDDPMQNARAGIRYLKQLDKQSGGDPALTAAGYYGGPGGLEKARNGIAVSDPRNPHAPNTLEYGQQVASRLPGQKGAAAATPALPRREELVQAQAIPAPQVEATPIPPELMAQAQEPAPALPVQATPQGDPWQEFNQRLALAQQQRPVQVADLSSYGQAPQMGLQVPSFQPGPVQSLRPDFRAFGAWGGFGHG